jgi:ubiquinone/menaquinone biosynthesis C-methylase UbiE
MEKIPDWLKIWSELAEIRNTHFALQEEGQSDHWSENARKFSDRVRERWQEPDTSRDFLKSALLKNPESTLLDIGAGTGNWAIISVSLCKKNHCIRALRRDESCP